MKKNLFISLLVIGSTILLIMCTKQPSEVVQNENNSLDRTTFIEKNILNFKDKVNLFGENPGLKLSDPMHIDSCIWYVESTLNYTYADIENERDTMYFDSCFIDIDLINGRVEISEAVAAYGKFEDTLSAQYNEINESNEHFVLADIFVTTSSSSEATLCMLSVFIAGGAINTMSFNSTYDYWWYGQAAACSGGYCGGPNNGQDTCDDAAEQIERKVRYRAAVPSGRYYSINDFTVFVRYDLVREFGVPSPNYYQCDLTNPNDTTENDNYYDYLIYRSYDFLPNPHGCLSPNEMNWYLNKMEYIINTKLYDCVDDIEDLDFTSLDMKGDQTSLSGNTLYVHQAIITYSELVFTTTSASRFD